MWLLCCLPPIGTESASCSIGFSKLNSPAHQYLCLRFKRYLAISPARLEARMDSLLSFPVGLFHPLQHAGLSRRSPCCRQYVRNVNSAWGACTPAPLPASRRSTHFKPLGILKSPHATTACGAPSRSSDLNGQGRPPLQGGEGDPRPSIRCDREWERFKRIKRRIISCAQLGPAACARSRTSTLNTCAALLALSLITSRY